MCLGCNSSFKFKDVIRKSNGKRMSFKTFFCQMGTFKGICKNVMLQACSTTVVLMNRMQKEFVFLCQVRTNNFSDPSWKFYQASLNI